METEAAGDEIPSAEILVAIATKEKHMFTSFRGLVDTGTSASLMDRALVPDGVPWLDKGKQSRWKTQAGVFETRGKVQVKRVKLPQFTVKRIFQADFHLFEKNEKDQYSFILGRDVLKKIKIDVLFSSQSFEWDHIQVKMVPRGQWSQGNIDSFWKSFKREQEISTVDNKVNSSVMGYPHELNQNQILDADYSAANFTEIARE